MHMLLNNQMHLRRTQRFPVFRQFVQAFQNLGSNTDSNSIADQRKQVTPTLYLDMQSLLYLLDMLVQAAAEIGQAMRIFRLQTEPVCLIITSHLTGTLPPEYPDYWQYTKGSRYRHKFFVYSSS